MVASWTTLVMPKALLSMLRLGDLQYEKLECIGGEIHKYFRRFLKYVAAAIYADP